MIAFRLLLFIQDNRKKTKRILVVLQRVLSQTWRAHVHLWIMWLLFLITFFCQSNVHFVTATGTIYPYYTPNGGSDYLWTIAGNGQISIPMNISTAPATSIPLNQPQGLYVTNNGDIYIADTDNFVIRFVNATTGVMKVIAGNGQTYPSNDVNPLYTGINRPTCVWIGESVAYSGINYYFVDLHNHLIRQVTSSNNNPPIVTTVIGKTDSGCGTYSSSDNNQPPLLTILCKPVYVVGDLEGNLYFTEIGNTYMFIRKLIKSTNIVTVIAGTGVTGYNGNNVAALSATYDEPTALWYDSVHHLLYVVDRFNYLIRCINLTNSIVTNIAGIPKQYSSPDSEANLNNGTYYALNTPLNYPNGLWGDNNGSLYITNTQDFLVQKVDLSTGIIKNVIGTSVNGYSNDVPPLSANLGKPWFVFIRNSFIYITCDSTNYVQVVYPRIHVPTAQPTSAPIEVFYDSGDSKASFDNVQTPVLASSFVAVTCALFASFFANHRNKVNKKVVTTIKSLFMLCISMMIFGWSFISFIFLIYVCLANDYTHAAGYWLIILKSVSVLLSMRILYRALSHAKAKPKKKMVISAKPKEPLVDHHEKPINSTDTTSSGIRQDSDQVHNSTDSAGKDIVVVMKMGSSGDGNKTNHNSSAVGRFEEAEPGYFYISYSNIFASKQLYGLFMTLVILNITFIRYLPWYRSRATEKLDGFPSFGIYLKSQSLAIVYSLGLLITQCLLFYIRVVKYNDLTSTFSFTTLLCSLISNAILLFGHIAELLTIFHLIYQEYTASMGINKPRRRRKKKNSPSSHQRQSNASRHSSGQRRKRYDSDNESLADDDSVSDGSDDDSVETGESGNTGKKKKGKLRLSEFMMSDLTAAHEDALRDAIESGKGVEDETNDDKYSEGEVDSNDPGSSDEEEEEGEEETADSNHEDVENPVHLMTSKNEN